MKYSTTKSRTMKKLGAAVLASTLLFTVNAQAAKISSSGQAMSLCKEQAKANHADYKRAKLIKIKKHRKDFKVTLKITTDQGTSTAQCDVNIDGTVNYQT